MTKTSDKNDPPSSLADPVTVLQPSLPFSIQWSKPNERTPFIDAPANKEALAVLQVWRNMHEASRSRGNGVLITGPNASGKTFLAEELAALFNITVIRPAAMDQLMLEDFDASVFIVDDAHNIAPRLLVRFIDKCMEMGKSFALCGSAHPTSWAVEKAGTLIDLETRLSALPYATLQKPDVDLMSKVLSGLLSTRQIRLSEKLCCEAAEGLKRDFHCVSQFVELIDGESLTRQKKIDATMIQNVLRVNRDIAV